LGGKRPKKGGGKNSFWGAGGIEEKDDYRGRAFGWSNPHDGKDREELQYQDDRTVLRMFEWRVKRKEHHPSDTSGGRVHSRGGSALNKIAA